jgi:hypothetical protein
MLKDARFTANRKANATAAAAGEGKNSSYQWKLRGFVEVGNTPLTVVGDPTTACRDRLP